MTEKRFTIDVEIEHYENAYFENDKFLCYEDDYDAILKRLNELAEENENITLLAQHNYEESKRIINKYVDKIKELKKKNKELEELVSEVDNELEIRDTVCGAGKFRLEEWGKHRYHQFYKGDEELEDETVVIMLMELEKENVELKQQLTLAKPLYSRRELENENQLLKQALREMLENSGNKYLIDLFDKIFDLNYYEWEKKMNDTHTYDYVEWEEVLKKGDKA